MRFHRKRAALLKSDEWHFHQDNTPVHYSILVTDYLTKMDIKTVFHLPSSPYLASFDFWLFPKLRGCRYEIIEEMEEAVTKIIDTLTPEDFDGAFQKLFEQYNKIHIRAQSVHNSEVIRTCLTRGKISEKVEFSKETRQNLPFIEKYVTSFHMYRSFGIIHFKCYVRMYLVFIFPKWTVWK